jgi:KaiC/GvpD/RAD55 family RecA-like ATPase
MKVDSKQRFETARSTRSKRNKKRVGRRIGHYELGEFTYNLDGIAKFLALRGHTLLIKGSPGAGKTTLALQLLKHFGEKNALYISSRESSEKLSSEISWAKSTLKNSVFEDVRLSSATAIIEKVIKAQERGKINAVVLDTWDGLAKEIENEKERLKAEKMLISLADGSSFRIVFVSEEPNKTTMDYLVDGIIELNRFEENSRILREVEMQKLRGTFIEQHKYLYTLAGGMFRHFVPYSTPDYSSASRPLILKDGGDIFSFGSNDVDDLFGGIRKGSTFAIEYDESVPFSAIRTIEVPAVINALNTGKGVIMIPLPGSSTIHLFSLVQPFVSEKAFKERFAIAAATESKESAGKKDNVENDQKNEARSEGKSSSSFILMQNQIDSSQDSFEGALERVRQNSRGKGVLLIESISLLENIFAKDRETVLARLADRVARVQHGSQDALVFLLQEDSMLRSRVLALSSHYAKMFVRDRSVVVMGEKPSTVATVLEHSQENPILPTLTPIV